MLAEGSATKLGGAERELEANLEQWTMAMFGEVSTDNLSWQEFVAVRSSWDRFVVAPGTLLSSAIPVGWLLPQPLTDNSWRNAVASPDQETLPS